MAYTALELQPMDKESDDLWNTEDASTEFLDQYVVLEGSSAESTSTTDDDFFANLINQSTTMTDHADMCSVTTDPVELRLQQLVAVTHDTTTRQEQRTASATYSTSRPPQGYGSISDSELLKLEGLSMR